MIVQKLTVNGTTEEVGVLRTDLPGSHPLAGMQVKLERAREQLEELNKEMESFFERGAFAVYEQRKQSGREVVFRVRVRENPPLAWSAIIGDCLQNMRSSLDYLAWELATLNTSGTPPETTGFPIYIRPDEYHSVRKDGKPQSWSGLRKTERMAGDVQAVVEDLQPFRERGGLSPGVLPTGGFERLRRLNPLWILKELSRFDRHRALRLVGATSLSLATSSGGHSGGSIPEPVEQEVKLGSFVDGGMVARYVFSEPNEDARLSGLGVSLQLEDEVSPEGWSVVLVLGKILDHIDSNVMPKFLRFFED